MHIEFFNMLMHVRLKHKYIYVHHIHAHALKLARLRLIKSKFISSPKGVANNMMKSDLIKMLEMPQESINNLSKTKEAQTKRINVLAESVSCMSLPSNELHHGAQKKLMFRTPTKNALVDLSMQVFVESS